MHGHFIALSIRHRSLSHSTLIKPSDVLSDGTGHITTRVHPQDSHSFTRREDNDLRRRVTTQCDTWQHNLPNVREVLGTASYCDSRHLLTNRELPNIREIIPLVLLSRVPLRVFILPTFLLNFVDRHATETEQLIPVLVPRAHIQLLRFMSAVRI